MELKKARLVTRWIALIAYLGLLALLLNWFTWISPPVTVPRSLILIVMLVPLLFPLRGILHGKPYTHEWTSYLSLFYFAIGIDIAYTVPKDRALALTLILLSLMLFIGCSFYGNYRKRELALERLQSPEDIVS